MGNVKPASEMFLKLARSDALSLIKMCVLETGQPTAIMFHHEVKVALVTAALKHVKHLK